MGTSKSVYLQGLPKTLKNDHLMINNMKESRNTKTHNNPPRTVYPENLDALQVRKFRKNNAGQNVSLLRLCNKIRS